jgi:hypothetical protein
MKTADIKQAPSIGQLSYGPGQPTPSPISSKSASLSDGAITGIAIACVVTLISVIGMMWFAFANKSPESNKAKPASEQEMSNL